jgi:hypothetical protein
MSVSWPYFGLGIRGHGALLFGQSGLYLPFRDAGTAPRA